MFDKLFTMHSSFDTAADKSAIKNCWKTTFFAKLCKVSFYIQMEMSLELDVVVTVYFDPPVTGKPLRLCVELFECRPASELPVQLAQRISTSSLQSSTENCRKVPVPKAQ